MILSQPLCLPPPWVLAGAWRQWEAGDGDHAWSGAGTRWILHLFCAGHPDPPVSSGAEAQLGLSPAASVAHCPCAPLLGGPLISDVGDEREVFPLPRTQPTLEGHFQTVALFPEGWWERALAFCRGP